MCTVQRITTDVLLGGALSRYLPKILVDILLNVKFLGIQIRFRSTGNIDKMQQKVFFLDLSLTVT